MPQPTVPSQPVRASAYYFMARLIMTASEMRTPYMRRWPVSPAPTDQNLRRMIAEGTPVLIRAPIWSYNDQVAGNVSVMLEVAAMTPEAAINAGRVLLQDHLLGWVTRSRSAPLLPWQQDWITSDTAQ